MNGGRDGENLFLLTSHASLPHSRLDLQLKMGFLLHVRPDVEASIEAEKKFNTDLFSANESTSALFLVMMLEIVLNFIVSPSILIAKFPRNI